MKNVIIEHVRDSIFLIGLVGFDYGIWLLSKEAAFIVGGLILMTLAFPRKRRQNGG